MPKVRRRATTQSRARFSPYHRQPRSSTREAKDELYSSTVAKQPISTHPPTNSAMYALTINALPTEIRQQIFLEYITTSSNDITMWHPPGARLFKFMVLVPCNVEWWLAGLRALKLLSTCKQWHVDMIFVFEHLSRQTELEYKQTFVASYINYHSEVVKSTRTERLYKLDLETQLWRLAPLLLLGERYNAGDVKNQLKDLRHLA